MMIRLGDEVRDKISGFAGVVTCRSEFENGCIRCCVTARELHEGKIVEEWFDEQRLESQAELATQARVDRIAPGPKVGGPGPNPPRRDPPARSM